MTTPTRTLILTHADVAQLADMALAVSAVEAAFAAHARGDARMPSKVYLDLPQFQGDFRAMPSLMGLPGQLVNAHPRTARASGSDGMALTF